MFLFICRLSLGTISKHKSSEWRSQQGALITHFNQLYRWRALFRRDHCEFPFCLSTLLDECAGRAKAHIYLTLRGAASLLSAVVAGQHKKDELSCSPKTTQESHKASSVRSSRCYRGWNDGQRKGFYQWRIPLSRQNILACLRQCQYLFFWKAKRQWCGWRLKSLIWLHVTVAKVMDQLFNRPTIHTAKPISPFGKLLLALLEIQWND